MMNDIIFTEVSDDSCRTTPLTQVAVLASRSDGEEEEEEEEQ